MTAEIKNSNLKLDDWQKTANNKIIIENLQKSSNNEIADYNWI